MNRQIGFVAPVLRFQTVVLVCVLCSTPVFTQVAQDVKLHTPSEIMKIMDESKLIYEVGLDFVAAPVDSPVVLSNQMYLRQSENGHSLRVFSISEQAQSVFDRAEEAFHSGKFEEAIALYRHLLEVQPEYLHALTLIGDAFFSMQQFDSAKAYFLRSIDLNFADYNAHWFLADTYNRTGDTESALRETTIAHLLNVNHANLQKAIRYNRKRTDRPWKEWAFKPEYTISKEGDKVIIKTPPEWMGYAMVKAVWAYEPGYAASMLNRQRDSLLIVWPEEKEAIATLLVSNDKLKHINDIVDKGFFQEFVLYEIAAPRYPGILVLLPQEDFMRVVKYVNMFH